MKMSLLASTSTKLQKVHCHGYRMSYHLISNSTFSKSYKQTFLMEFNFFQQFDTLLKFMYENELIDEYFYRNSKDKLPRL